MEELSVMQDKWWWAKGTVCNKTQIKRELYHIPA